MTTAPIELQTHMRLHGSEPAFADWRRLTPRNLPRTMRFVNTALTTFSPYTLSHNGKLERIEFLLKRGQDIRLKAYEAYIDQGGPIPVMGAAEMADFLEQELMEYLFRNQAIFSILANVYVALHTADPTDAMGGAEASGGSYARVAVDTTSGWAAPGATSGQTNNVAAVTFTTATASWGTISHAALWDAATVGNGLFHSPVDTSKLINTDDTAEFAATTGIVVTVA